MAKIKGVWVFNQVFTGEFDYQVTDISFMSNNTEFDGIAPSGSGGNSVMYYNRIGVSYWDFIAQSTYHGYTNGWKDEAYRTVDFGTTEQTVPDDFYTWMQANATQQAEPTTPKRKFTKLFLGNIVHTVGSRTFRKLSTEEPVVEDELQGTWVFNDTLTLDTTVDYSVNFTSNGVPYIALTVWHADTVMPRPKDLYFANSDVELEVYYNGWHEQIYKTIIVTSKLAEVENGEELLAWLKANATKQGATTPTLINFTIAGTSYQAEEGMTWKEWASSLYNTSEYRWGDTTNRLGYNDGMYQHYIQASGAFVLGDDVIINGFAYTDYKHAGGGAD